MKTAHHKVKQNMTVTKAVLIASCTSLLVTIILSALGAYLIWNETIPQNATDALTAVLRLVSMVIGCVIAILISADKKAIASAVTAGAYTVMLVCMNILVMDGRMGNLLFGLIMAVCAWLISIGIYAGANQSKGKRRKIRIR